MKYKFSNGEELEYSPKIFKVVEEIKENTKFPFATGKIRINPKDVKLSQTSLNDILGKLSLPLGMSFVKCQDSLVIGKGTCACGENAPTAACDNFIVTYNDEQRLLREANGYISTGRIRRKQLKDGVSAIPQGVVKFAADEKFSYQNSVLFFMLGDGSSDSIDFTTAVEVRKVFECFWELRRRNPGKKEFSPKEIIEIYEEIFSENIDRRLLSTRISNMRRTKLKPKRSLKNRISIDFNKKTKAWIFSLS